MNSNEKQRTKRTKRKKAVKSHGSQLEIKAKNYGLFIDWLTINLQGEPNTANEKYEFEYQDYSTRHFKNVVHVSNGSEKIGVLLYERLNSKIGIENWCQFKFENHLFYTKTGEQLKRLKDDLLSDLNLNFYGVSRLDLALDFQNASEKVQNFYKAISNEEIYIGGREKDFDDYNALRGFSKTKGGRRTLEGFTLGSKKSRKYTRVYNKTLELQKNNKSYITETWDNLKIKGEVWRLEYQMNSTYLKSIKEFDFDKIFTKEFQLSLLEKCMDKHFVFHKAIRGRELNKMPQVYLINLERVKKYCSVVTKALTNVKRVIKETLIGQMRSVKSNLRAYFSTGQSIDYILAVNRTLEDFNLWSWFHRKKPFYLEEFEKKQIIKSFDKPLFEQHLNLHI